MNNEFSLEQIGVLQVLVKKFAEAVVNEINREDEDGSTLLTRMLDKAISRAVEDGCEGVDHS